MKPCSGGDSTEREQINESRINSLHIGLYRSNNKLGNRLVGWLQNRTWYWLSSWQGGWKCGQVMYCAKLLRSSTSAKNDMGNFMSLHIVQLQFNLSFMKNQEQLRIGTWTWLSLNWQGCNKVQSTWTITTMPSHIWQKLAPYTRHRERNTNGLQS